MIPRYGHRVEPPGVEPRCLGPDKDALPSACKLGTVPPDLIAAAQRDLARAGTVNHLGDAGRYPMSAGVTLEGYRQVLLQHAATDGSFQRDYHLDAEGGEAVPLLRALYPDLGLYRARLLVLEAGHAVPWHVDEAPREFARLHFMIEGRAGWRLRRRGEAQAWTMTVGEVWWASVGWPHMIHNVGTERRVVLMLHADWDRMTATFGDLREDARAAA